jgi:hypothetical protein
MDGEFAHRVADKPLPLFLREVLHSQETFSLMVVSKLYGF